MSVLRETNADEECSWLVVYQLNDDAPKLEWFVRKGGAMLFASGLLADTKQPNRVSVWLTRCEHQGSFPGTDLTD